MAESQIERYTRGFPINETLAAMRDDPNFVARQMAEVQPRVAEPLDEIERELERSERLALKEMRGGPGWPVLQRLLEKTVHFNKKRVISISESDPLGNQQTIANQWAYQNSLRMAMTAVTELVDAEVKLLDEQARKQ